VAQLFGLFAGLQSSRVLRHWLEEVPTEELRYIAPEILAGGDGSPASDIYAMAAMLVDLSVGTDGKSRREADKKLEEQAPERWRAIHGALSENAINRPSSAAQLLASMELLWSGNVGESEAPQTAPVIIAVGTEFGAEESTETTLDDYIGGQKLLDDDDESDPYPDSTSGVESSDDFFVSEVVAPAPVREKVKHARELDVDEGAEAFELGSYDGGEADNDTIINLVAKPAVDSHVQLQPPLQDRPAAQGELFSSFQDRKSSSGFLPLLVAALVAGAAAYLLSRSQGDSEPSASSSQEKTPDAGVATEDSTVLVAEPLPICPTSMLHLAEKSLCIDAYESPGLGQLPTVSISLEDARRACEARGVRLCLAVEWEGACRHKGNQSFGYGNRYRAEICNLQSEKLGPAGGKGECHTDIGVYDLNGNAAEWVHEGEIRGGSALDGSTGRCSLSRAKPEAAPSYSDVGFRCCADAIASP
ncbi:MAG: SUMF1/EgtB/PvdO family nonheme iron enzyme, partial [Planctomycetota bacterium]